MEKDKKYAKKIRIFRQFKIMFNKKQATVG